MVSLPDPGKHRRNPDNAQEPAANQPPIQPVTSQDILPRLARITAFVENFHGKDITNRVDATPLVSFAQDFGREDLLTTKRDPRSYSPEEFQALTAALNKTFGIHNGEIFIVNLVGTNFSVFSGQISLNTLVNCNYLNRTLTEGLVSLRCPTVDSGFVGFTLGPLALRDFQRCENDARNIWQDLNQRSHLDEVPFFKQLKYIIGRPSFSEGDYIEIGGHNRQRFAFLQKAKDQTFGTALGYSEFSYRKHILSPVSILGKDFNHADGSLESIAAGIFITGYSSAVGGLLMELATYQAADKPMFGAAAVFDFLFEHSMRDMTSRDFLDDEHFFEGNSSKLLFQRLRTYTEELNPSYEKILKMLWRENPEKTLQNCIEVFSHIYSIDFLTDTQRAEIVAKVDGKPL
jgi:hypothetical protein